MARTPTSIVSGVINTIRGQFSTQPATEPAIVKQRRIITSETEDDAIRKGTKIIQNTNGGRAQNLLSSTALGQQMYMDSAQKEIENREIMSMFPDLERNARYLIASCFSPVDLNITKIPVSTNAPGLTSNQRQVIQSKLTDYFEQHLELSTELPDLYYTAGFITGGELVVTVPRLSVVNSFNQIISTEGLKNTISHLPTNGFSNLTSSMSIESLKDRDVGLKTKYDDLRQKVSGRTDLDSFFSGAISAESLSLTDNVSALSVASMTTEHNDQLRAKNAKDIASMRVTSKPQPTAILNAPTPIDKITVMNEPLSIRVSTKSCFFIFPPGAPDKPTAAILILDETGAPITLGAYGGSMANGAMAGGATAASLFQDVGQASVSTSNTDYMQIEGQRQLQSLYRTFMSSYITSKVADAGYGSVSIGEADAVFKSMFYRYLEKRTTRLLIIPRQYFTYFAYDVNQNGIGVTKIEGIKKYLVMKMVVLVSRVLAAMRGAADTRKITVTLDSPNMVPEDVVQSQVLKMYCEKNLLNLDSLDFQAIQTRIISTALQIDVKNSNGTSAIGVENESTQQGKPVDFDPEILTYIDSQINNKVPVPASLTSSLDEPELATTITTANLFYSMCVSMDQRIMNKQGSTRIRQYARDSEGCRKIIAAALGKDTKIDRPAEFSEPGSIGSTANPASDTGVTVDDVIDHLSIILPKPIISKNRAQFTSLSDMIDAVTKIVDTLLPAEYAGDDQDAAAALRAVKMAAVKDVAVSIAGSAGITQLDLNSVNVTRAWEDTMDNRQRLKNIAKALKDQDSAISPTDASGTAAGDGTSDSTTTDGYGSQSAGY